VAQAVQRMGKEMGDIGHTETVRRGLILLDFMLSLREDEELTVRNKNTGVAERIRFSWATFD
jgi:hypothetical protein